MDKVNRRKFLQLAGAGAAAGVATALPAAALLAHRGTVNFRAVSGLPAKPLPSYASLVLEGRVDVAAQSGIVTRTLFAGHPEGMTGVALPGLSQMIRVTKVQTVGDLLEITGMVDDRSQLQTGESRIVQFQVDGAAGMVRTQFRGTSIALALDR